MRHPNRVCKPLPRRKRASDPLVLVPKRLIRCQGNVHQADRRAELAALANLDEDRHRLDHVPQSRDPT